MSDTSRREAKKLAKTMLKNHDTFWEQRLAQLLIESLDRELASRKQQMNRKKLETAIALGYAHSATVARIQIDQPVNICPDDDLPGERPVQKVWAYDVNRIAEVIADEVFAAFRGDR